MRWTTEATADATTGISGPLLCELHSCTRISYSHIILCYHWPYRSLTSSLVYNYNDGRDHNDFVLVNDTQF